MPDEFSYDGKAVTAKGMLDSLSSLLTHSPATTVLGLAAIVSIAFYCYSRQKAQQARNTAFYGNSTTQSVRGSTIEGSVEQNRSRFFDHKKQTHQEVAETTVKKGAKVKQKLKAIPQHASPR